MNKQYSKCSRLAHEIIRHVEKYFFSKKVLGEILCTMNAIFNIVLCVSYGRLSRVFEICYVNFWGCCLYKDRWL